MLVYMPNLWVGNPFFTGTRHRRRYRQPRPQPLPPAGDRSETTKLNFLEAVYSFLFGEGDPNPELEARSQQTIAQRISANRGVLIAEEVLPYLPQPLAQESLDEDYVLPTLIQFDGLPEVSDRGDIIYRFPTLQSKASSREVTATSDYLRELPWVFSGATYRQSVTIGVLGAVNFALWAGLQTYSGTVAGILGLPVTGVAGLFGIFGLYGALFLIVPLVRWFALKRRNVQIEERNRQRNAWGDRLQDPPQHLRIKLQYSHRFASETVFTGDSAAYTTEKDAIEQGDLGNDD